MRVATALANLTTLGTGHATKDHTEEKNRTFAIRAVVGSLGSVRCEFMSIRIPGKGHLVVWIAKRRSYNPRN
uniref:Putative secreted protein n=1 Tax=Anopheles darlingi TaxID=43151 RepID=A0A2M4DG06_ANODA